MFNTYFPYYSSHLEDIYDFTGVKAIPKAPLCTRIKETGGHCTCFSSWMCTKQLILQEKGASALLKYNAHFV